MARDTDNMQHLSLPRQRVTSAAWRFFLCIPMFGSAFILAAITSPLANAQAGASEQKVTAALVKDVKRKTDEELTLLTAQWGNLSPAQRRVLLAEVRSRMQSRQRAAQAAPRVKVTRRYGRIVRKPDGSVVMQTRVIRPQQSTPVQTQSSIGQSEQAKPPGATDQSTTSRPVARGRITFGFGFERRISKSKPNETSDVAVQDLPLSDELSPES